MEERLETNSAGRPARETTELCVNRELSWLKFNERVLAQATLKNVPLLEQVRFLCIFSSNLDEFFMKRVGALRRQVAAGVGTGDVSSPSEILYGIRQEVIRLTRIRSQILEEQIKPGLEREGIELLPWDELTAEEIKVAEEHFHRTLFPLLTPLAVDRAHPFPLISSLSHSFGIALVPPGSDAKLFARVKTSIQMPQWLRVNRRNGAHHYRFVSLRDIVSHHLEVLFPGVEIVSCMPFRITRNADIEVIDDEAEDLLELIEEEVRRRRFAKVVRFETLPNPDPWLLTELVEKLELDLNDIYEVEGELDPETLETLADLELPSLRFKPWAPVPPPAFSGEDSVFSVIRDRDLLVHHPYESFSATVGRFIGEAVEDPLVRAIKMTLYRTGEEDPFVPLLIRAAEAGKQVVCLIELQARFDEERNIRWATQLEDAGVPVVFGLSGLKTHAKTIIVVREDEDGIRTYAHIGTGNYHATTAKLYTDLGLFTSRQEHTDELLRFFNYLSGRSETQHYETLLVAPVNMRARFEEMIRREIEHAKQGRPAQIIVKCNSFQDSALSGLLYQASQAGVRIDLFVRGFCTLRPHVRGLSDNIRVISIVGRLLEHSRIFYFRNGEPDPLAGEFFIGSADWMTRNLDNRVEIVAPVSAPQLRAKCWEILEIIVNDFTQTWEMQSDGFYVHRHPLTSSDCLLGSQEVLMEQTKKRGKGHRKGHKGKKHYRHGRHSG